MGGYASDGLLAARPRLWKPIAMTPQEKIHREAEAASIGLQSLMAARSYEEAEAGWSTFLTHWARALNKCQVYGGRRLRGQGWVSVEVRVRRDPALQYVWESRNEDTHGLSDISAARPAMMTLNGTGSALIKSFTIDGDGGTQLEWEPLSPGGLIKLEQHPEALILQTVSKGRNAFSVPAGYDNPYDGSAVKRLAQYAHDFLKAVLAETIG